jgi:MSHA biogenesis protein MshO
MTTRSARGFSLIEAIAVMVITGIIVGMVAIFIQRPVEGYFSSTSRAAMADTADTALRRIGRDVRLALPNTVRVAASGLFLEFIPIKTGGRYQQNDACFTAGMGCTTISTFGDMLSNVQVTTGSDLVAIYNQYNNSGADCSPTTAGLYSAYCGQGITTLTSVAGAGTTVNALGFANTVFLPPGGSPSRRVFIIAASPVTYTCDGASNTVWRISGYARQAAQPTSLVAAPLSTATTKVPLATDVTCPAIVAGSVPPRFSYSAGASERYSLLSAWITLLKSGETVNLLHQIHVDNTP